MYAVIETGGKQYRVEVGTELEVELLDAEPGKTITVGRVLLIADGDDASIGRPVVDGAAVSAEVVRQGRGEKVISFKYGPKTRRRVKKGHRQDLTVLRISDITLDGKSAAKSAAKAESDAKTERQRLEEAAAAQAAKDAELAAKLAASTKASIAKADTKTTETKKTATKKTATKAETTSKAPAKADTTADAKPTTTKKATTRAKASGAKAADEAATATDKPVPKKRATKPRATKKDE